MRFAFLKAHTGGVLGLEMITFVEPLGLEYIAGALEGQGHTCLILDLRIDSTDVGMIKLREFAPQAVGIQSNFTTERFRALKLARRVKQDCPDTFVVLGGHDASREPSWYRDDAVDAIVIGDGEEVIIPLAETLDAGGDLEKVPGLMVRRGGDLIFSREAPARGNLDELPMPARHLITDYAPHYYFNFQKPLALLETARGCPYRCNFCSVWQFHEKTFREKSPERVVEELKQIDAPHVFITDDIFWLNVKRGKEMARLIQQAGIKKCFKIQTRTDIIVRHPELVEMWKDCGNLSIFLGLEKIDDAGLASVNKNNKAANNDRAIEILQELGVGYTPNFIVDPDWGREDFAKLREWISRTGAYNSGFSVLTPLPGTQLWDKVKDQVTTDDWELYDIVHSVLPTKLPMEEFYEEYAGLWRHALDVRYQERGYLRTHLALGLALATGKVTLSALRKGMNLGKWFSRPTTFMRAHEESKQRVQPRPEVTTPSMTTA